MQLAKAFERLVLARVEQLPRSPRGRPLKLANADALALMFNAQHIADICKAVERVHRATVHLYELLNVHVRASLERDGTCPREVFDANALVKAFQDVTSLHGDARAPASFLADAFAHVPDFERVPRQGLTQVLTYAAGGIATCAKNNVWMHFQSHVHKHVRHALRIE